MTLLSFFAIKSHDDKYFRAKGYGGSGESWVADIKKAKIYGKIGPARGVVSWWVNNYPEVPAPELVELVVTKEVSVPIDVKKIKKDRLKRDLARANNNLKYYEQTQNASFHVSFLSKIDKALEEIEKLKKQIKAL